jgi:uncharacterized protein
MDELPPEFWHGVSQFNQRQFYACHDTLEALWITAAEPEKTFYQGILQIAVGLYHLDNLNWKGAVILLGEGLYRLRNYDPEHGGVDVDQFRDESSDILSWLQAAGPEQVEQCRQQLGYPTEAAIAKAEAAADVAVPPIPSLRRLLAP